MQNVAAFLRTRAPPTGSDACQLASLEDFGSNPGALSGWCHVPVGTTDMPLVVVLHGCTQTVAAYDRGAGWSDLAERYGFAVLFPEQQRANNANLCFNWFVPEDVARDSGEALSIRQMIGAMCARNSIDPACVFVTGLSAGGAMASVMLATYPELFAGGGIIAGLPYGAATSVAQALQLMRGHGQRGEHASSDRLRAASSHAGPWPRISVWQGEADTTVAPSNADAIIAQWRGVHGVGAAPDRVELVDGHRRRVWLDRAGQPAIEEYRIAGMGHGTPLRTRGDDACGTAGPHMLEAGISSTGLLAAQWGLLDAEPRQRDAAAARTADASAVSNKAAPTSVHDTIQSALRAAGLMR